MAEMKKSYLNHVADLCTKYANACLEKCITLGIPDLQFQNIIEEDSIQRYGEAIPLLSKSAEWNISANAEVYQFYNDLITAKKLPVDINDISGILMTRMIIRQFHYPDLRLWLFEYETHEYEFPNEIKWNVTLCYAMPSADPFSGCRWSHLYKVIDSECNERIVNDTLNDTIVYSGIEPDIRLIDYTLGQKVVQNKNGE